MSLGRQSNCSRISLNAPIFWGSMAGSRELFGSVSGMPSGACLVDKRDSRLGNGISTCPPWLGFYLRRIEQIRDRLRVGL